jgi:hypothetical protein
VTGATAPAAFSGRQVVIATAGLRALERTHTYLGGVSLWLHAPQLQRRPWTG